MVSRGICGHSKRRNLLTRETQIVMGRIPEKSGKRPKRGKVGRVCSYPSCDTKLTSYNTHDACYQHRPQRFPRVRGRIR